MTKDLYRYTFASEAPLAEIEASLLLALFSVEALHGESATRLDAAHFFDPDKRVCVIDGGTTVGRDLNRLFIGYLRAEFGEDSFQVERLEATTSELQPAAVGA